MKKTSTRLKKPSLHGKADAFREALLGWYDQNRRDLPWRYKPGEVADPYMVWLSEIMLQQTTVAAVIPYFLRFTALWPDVFALAAADINDVMREWAGLGYYARARNLHKCAQVVAYERGGVFPEDQKELMTLPGIGEYTSAAIRAIAFGKPATVVDGNVERVMARVHGLHGDRQEVKKQAKDYARAYFEGYEERPGDLAQAFMDLGATVCTPKVPQCKGCAVRVLCVSRCKSDWLADQKREITVRDSRQGIVFWVEDEKRRVLMQRRSPYGILGGLVGFPTSGWEDAAIQDRFSWSLQDFDYEEITGSVRHIFTHIHLTLKLRVVRDSIRLEPPEQFFWCEPELIGSMGLPSLFTKTLAAFKEHGLGQD